MPGLPPLPAAAAAGPRRGLQGGVPAAGGRFDSCWPGGGAGGLGGGWGGSRRPFFVVEWGGGGGWRGGWLLFFVFLFGGGGGIELMKAKRRTLCSSWSFSKWDSEF